MATQKTRKSLGGARGASSSVGNYFATPPVSIPVPGVNAAAPEILPPEQAMPSGGRSGDSSGGSSGNITPGLDTLDNDTQSPGAGLSQTTPSSPGTLQDFSKVASGISNVLAPVAIGTRDAGLFGVSRAVGTAGKVAGIGADIGAQNYGKAMVGAASFLPGPVGLALGAGRAAYDAYQGYNTGVTGPDSSMAAQTAANVGAGFPVGRSMQNAAFGSGGFFGTPLADVPAANPMQQDPATMGGGYYGYPDTGTESFSAPGADTSPDTTSDTGPDTTSDTESRTSTENPGGGWSGGGFADGGPVGLSMSGYADGGEVGGGPLLAMGFANGGPTGGPGMSRPGMGADTSPQMIEMRVNQMARNPQFRQKIMETMQPLLQSGELTPQEITVMGQIAMASMQNPKLYPQLRQFVAAQGMSPLPPSYDPMTIIKILSVTRALEQSGGGMAQPGQGQPTPAGQIPPTSQAQMVNPTGGPDGGMLQGPGTGRSDSIGTQNLSTGGPVKVSNGEYVIPEHVVRAKGRDFFDALLRRYSEVPKAEA
jgi:hypothetical protein